MPSSFLFCAGNDDDEKFGTGLTMTRSHLMNVCVRARLKSLREN